MENNGKKEGLYAWIVNETQKPDFRKALMVFFVCAIGGTALGLIFDEMQLGVGIGIGLGVVWMGVAYFNQGD